MARYRKKPVVIEAWRWDESLATLSMLKTRGMKWSGHRGHRGHPDLCQDLRIKTLEGTLTIELGDWIIRDGKGEFYQIKDEIFRETYEKVTDA